MTTSMQPSYRQMLIEQQLQPSIVYLHRSSGVRHQVAYTSGGVSELHPSAAPKGKCRKSS